MKIKRENKSDRLKKTWSDDKWDIKLRQAEILAQVENELKNDDSGEHIEK